MKKITLPFYVRLGFVLFILIAAGYLAVLAEKLLVPLLFSFLFAIVLLPLANFFENRLHFPRGVAAILSVLLFFTGATLIIYLLGEQLASLTTEWPLLKIQISSLYHNLQGWLQQRFHINVERQTAYINDITQKAFSSSGMLVERTIFSLSGIFLLLIFMLLYTFFLLLYRRLLMRFIVAAFTEHYSSLIYDIAEQVKYIVRKYITGLFLEMTVITILACLAFALLGVKYIFLLGLMVGLFNLIPYVGIFTALILSVLITFATTDPRHALYVAVTIVGIHLLDSNILMPKIVGAQVRLNPLIVILGVVSGEMIWSIPGMFLAIPYLAIAKVIFDRVPSLQPWGILLSEEEHPPKRVKRIVQKIKNKEQSS
jgi:putative permease